ncbi:hypothetical protein [Pseudoxanthomonas sp. UTMC 1351]|uniref:hypothetical protein n=1 Tax=Pseudoxanthomonas sp. UTMC 1351 TaxID=2695853 RepID=UPI0034CE4A4A
MQPFLFSLSPLLAAMVLITNSTTAVAGEHGQISAPPSAIETALPLASTHPSNFSDASHPLEIPFVITNEFGQPVDPGTLSGLRGGYDVAENNIDVDGSVDGNSANGVIAGANTISDGAFANANGLSTVIQNSGSNVLIQNAMIVKVDFGGSNP